VACRLLM